MLKNRTALRALALGLCAVLCLGALGGCGNADTEKPETPTEKATSGETGETPESGAGSETVKETETEEPKEKSVFDFDGSVSEETLRAYLSRAVTLSGGEMLSLSKSYAKDFILDVGAKYIARAATCWSPSAADYSTYNGQKNFISSVHKKDPDVVFEACLFECVNKDGINSIPVPAYVFEAFGKEPEERNFSYEDMIFEDGKYLNQWGTNSSVPDITRLETRMFFYYRATKYIDVGYEAFHMGQVNLMGAKDAGHRRYTELATMIREYAASNARRHFVFLNAHSHGFLDADGLLMFDFHMWPSRLHSDTKDADGNLTASVKLRYVDSIYGDSLGGKTHSGWTCEHLPYLVELDNWGAPVNPGVKQEGSIYVWGYDEISWFANQSDEYRRDFLTHIIDDVRNVDEDGYFAMPAERVAFILDGEGNRVSYYYYAYDKSAFSKGFGDQSTIKEVFADRAVGD